VEVLVVAAKRAMSMNKIFSQDGSALVMVVIASGLMLISFLAMMVVINSMEKNIDLQTAKQSATDFRQSMMALIDNDSNWAFNVGVGDSNMSCLRSNGAVCSSGPHSFYLYEVPPSLGGSPSGAVSQIYETFLRRNPDTGEAALYESQIAAGTSPRDVAQIVANLSESLGKRSQWGFDLSGNPCDEFGSNSGAECPFSYSFTWECLENPCPPTVISPSSILPTEPRIRIKAVLNYSPRKNYLRSTLNTTTYAIDVVRGTNSKTISRFCSSVEGIFNPSTMECERPSRAGDRVDCVAERGHPFVRFVGFENDGTPICADDPKLGGFCQTGTAVVAIRPDGTLQCGVF